MSNYLNSCKQADPVNLVLNRVGAKSAVNSHWNVIPMLRTWLDRYHQRQQLAALPLHMLNDIGITAEQQIEEATKPFWIE